MGTVVLLAARWRGMRAHESALDEAGLAASIMAAAAGSWASRERNLGESGEGLWTVRSFRGVS